MRHEFSQKVRVEAVMRSNGKCELCGRKMLHTGDFHFDHIIPDAIGGEPTLENCQVACKSCHKTKTTTEDVPRIAKAKRNYRKAHGIKKPSRFAGSRNSKFKKKLDGTVVLRSILNAR